MPGERMGETTHLPVIKGVTMAFWSRRAARLPRALLLSCSAWLLVQPVPLAAHFLFLPTIWAADETHPFGAADRHQWDAIGDFFYSDDWERLRFLGELQVSRNEQDMERLQVGWRIDPEASLWFGRFHNPISLWNTEHHHGRYLETSVGRPRIVEFEDQGGPLPVHLTGLLLESSHAMGEGAIQLDAAVASGPRFDGALGPIDVIRSPRFNKLALTARVAFRPDATRDTRYGFMLASTTMPAKGLAFEEIQQNTAGFSFIHEMDRLRVLGEAFRINHRVTRGNGATWPSYWAGYGQVEYKLSPNVWTSYVRLEGASSHLTADYRDAFPDLSKDRELVGVRWDFYRNQALKLQLAREAPLAGPVSRGVQIQWSALFP